MIVSCTRLPSSAKDRSVLYQSMQGMSSEVKLVMHYDNSEPLTQVYNRYINKKTAKKHDIVLFAHDDLYIDDLKLRGKLYGAVDRFDIIGLAGCVNPVIESPALWHRMSKREDWRGIVNHPYQHDINVITSMSFGPTPSRVLLVDGLFMAVNLKSVMSVGWKFNEEFSYHHYDLSSCLDANKLSLKIGVIPVNVIHVSKGLNDYYDKEFQQSQKKFLDIYGK